MILVMLINLQNPKYCTIKSPVNSRAFFYFKLLILITHGSAYTFYHFHKDKDHFFPELFQHG